MSGAMFTFYEAQLAQRNRRKRLVRTIMTVMRRRLDYCMFNLLVHPIRGKFDRAAAFRRAMEVTAETELCKRDNVNQNYAASYGPKFKPLLETDAAAFWEHVRTAARDMEMFTE